MDKSKNSRMAIVDLWKFIAAVMIMIHHLYYLSPAFEGKDYPGYFAWIYVEFFFILTGFFTYRHFARSDKQENILYMAQVQALSPLHDGRDHSAISAVGAVYRTIAAQLPKVPLQLCGLSA